MAFKRPQGLLGERGVLPVALDEVLAPNCLLDESGQDLIEYALLAAVLSVAFVASIRAVAGGVIPFFDMVLAAFRSL